MGKPKQTRKVPRRPTREERQGAIDRACVLAEQGEWLAAQRLWPQLEALGLVTQDDIEDALRAALREIAPKHYKGLFPPDQASEELCAGAELFPFVWDSSSRGCRMYFKFALTSSHLVVVSFHDSKRTLQ
jgi:hypothetical protein